MVSHDQELSSPADNEWIRYGGYKDYDEPQVLRLSSTHLLLAISAYLDLEIFSNKRKDNIYPLKTK